MSETPVFDLNPQQAETISAIMKAMVDSDAYKVVVSRTLTYERSVYLVESRHGERVAPDVRIVFVGPDGKVCGEYENHA